MFLKMPEKKHEECTEPIQSQIDQVAESYEYSHDAVFGEITEGGPNYRNVSRRKEVFLTIN